MFDPIGVEILRTYYIVSSKKNIKQTINRILFENLDTKKLDRERLSKDLFNDIGGSGERIVKYLESCFSKSVF